MNDKPTIFLSAAEASGDEHASRLILALRDRLPGARFIGVAGDRMAAAGCEVVADMTHKASMLGGPILQLGYYIRQVHRIKRAIRQIRPDVHVPVDSPALNWHLAAAARKSGAAVVYYIAPQVWAWAPWRVRKLARLTDRVACILPFEEAYLRHRGVNATYVGHPLLESLPPRPAKAPDLAEAWADGVWRVALLPGSRPGEISAHSVALLDTAHAIRKRWPKSRCIFTARTEESADAIRKAFGKRPFDFIDIAVGRMHEVLAESHFVVAVSGTVTLEVAHFGVPMVVLYRVGRWQYRLVGRWVIQTPHLSLVNILAGHKIVPELMPWHGKSRKVIDMVMEVMNDLGYLFEAREALRAVGDSLVLPGGGSASENAADIIVETLRKREADNSSG